MDEVDHSGSTPGCKLTNYGKLVIPVTLHFILIVMIEWQITLTLVLA